MSIGIRNSIKRIALDTMCFIYFFEANQKYGLLLKKLFCCLEKKRIQLITSTLTFAEILATAKIYNNKLLIEKHRQALLRIRNLILVPPDLAIAEKAAFFRVKYQLKLPDAIQLATGILAKAQLFITNDKKMKKVQEVKVLLLQDLL